MLQPPIPCYLELIHLLPSHETMKSMQNNHGLDHHIAFLGQRAKGQGDNKQGGIKKGGNQGETRMCLSILKEEIRTFLLQAAVSHNTALIVVIVKILGLGLLS